MKFFNYWGFLALVVFNSVFFTVSGQERVQVIETREVIKTVSGGSTVIGGEPLSLKKVIIQQSKPVETINTSKTTYKVIVNGTETNSKTETVKLGKPMVRVRCDKMKTQERFAAPSKTIQTAESGKTVRIGDKIYRVKINTTETRVQPSVNTVQTINKVVYNTAGKVDENINMEDLLRKVKITTSETKVRSPTKIIKNVAVDSSTQYKIVKVGSEYYKVNIITNEIIERVAIPTKTIVETKNKMATPTKTIVVTKNNVVTPTKTIIETKNNVGIDQSEPRHQYKVVKMNDGYYQINIITNEVIRRVAAPTEKTVLKMNSVSLNPNVGTQQVKLSQGGDAMYRVVVNTTETRESAAVPSKTIQTIKKVVYNTVETGQQSEGVNTIDITKTTNTKQLSENEKGKIYKLIIQSKENSGVVARTETKKTEVKEEDEKKIASTKKNIKILSVAEAPLVIANKINAYRTQLRIPKLVLGQNLAKRAETAVKAMKKGRNERKVSTGKDYVQVCESFQKIYIDKAPRVWYNTRADYNLAVPQITKKNMPFVVIGYKNSKTLGVAVAENNDELYNVCFIIVHPVTMKTDFFLHITRK
uniref:SCP domain-containing protein n=1 Tax=Parastrongyloides trichosuri TaxID=131310 RepID=A0A0N4Z7Q5_PARTI